LVLRTEHQLPNDVRKKVALFCNVTVDAVIESIDVPTIYDVPMKMKEEGLDVITMKKLALESDLEPDLIAWEAFLKKHKNPKKEIQLALVGKYVELPDAYKSISEAFIHSGAANETKVSVKMIHSEKLEQENIEEVLQGVHGILVAPGFGHRGIEGKIMAVKYARENNIPFLGICLGMQCAVIEFARNVLELQDAHSTEMHRNTPFPVIDIMEQQKGVTDMGGTMRLGAYDCILSPESNAFQTYGTSNISERHRHRYEFNNDYLEKYKNAGMVPSGINPDTNLVEIMEISNHPWFVGVQFHPEYKSTVLNPHPIFRGFVKAMVEYKERQK
jgi:CTP synthase